jgi:hypothetical protein
MIGSMRDPKDTIMKALCKHREAASLTVYRIDKKALILETLSSVLI